MRGGNSGAAAAQTHDARGNRKQTGSQELGQLVASVLAKYRGAIAEPAIWSMSPRQIFAYLEFAEINERRQWAVNLHLQAIATQGSGKDIEEQANRLMR
jgi:hypothetical protein